jgi:hypothetical protein
MAVDVGLPEIARWASRRRRHDRRSPWQTRPTRRSGLTPWRRSSGTCHPATSSYLGKDPTLCVLFAVPLGLNTRQRKRLVIRRRRSQADERSSPVAGNTGAQTGGRLRKGIKKPAISRDLKLRIAAVQDRRSRSSAGHRSRSALATSPAPGTVAPFDRVCDLQGRVAAHLSPGRFE